MELFDAWYRRAKRCFWLEFPDSMCLSTLDQDGFPDGRMVLLKAYDRRGFVFYTNGLSRKGRSLARLPRAGLTFYWEALQRQVRIQGGVESVSDAESDAYFSSRLRRSQIGAWASLQSQELESRKILEGRVKEFALRFRGQAVPRPPHWHGYRVVPHRIEFWRLRLNRLHDRFLYLKQPDGSWEIARLYP